ASSAGRGWLPAGFHRKVSAFASSFPTLPGALKDIMRKYLNFIYNSRPQEQIALFPAVIRDAGEPPSRRFLQFSAAYTPNPNPRAAYARAVARFLRWCEARGLSLGQVEPVVVAAYVEQLRGSAPTVKQHLAAIRMLFDWLVIGQVAPYNPAGSVR